MVRITTMRLRVEGRDIDWDNESAQEYDAMNQTVVDGINWSQAEDAINDQLPDGYYCKVDD